MQIINVYPDLKKKQSASYCWTFCQVLLFYFTLSNPVKTLKTWRGRWSSRFPAKKYRSSQGGGMNDIIRLSHAISHQTPVLQVVSSLWADVDLDGTTPEDGDSPLDHGFADISLRVQ